MAGQKPNLDIDVGNWVRVRIGACPRNYNKECIINAILICYDYDGDPKIMIPNDLPDLFDYSKCLVTEEHFISSFGMDLKYAGVYYQNIYGVHGEILKDLGPAGESIFGKNSALVVQYPDGMSCCLCKEPNNYALPNLDDGRYACFQCRTTKQWMF